MEIVVCVKQVPDTTEVKIDPVKNTLIREGVPSIVNPFDKIAVKWRCSCGKNMAAKSKSSPWDRRKLPTH